MNVHVSHEKKRGCGFRSAGAGGVGIYLMGGRLLDPCERLPFPLAVCPCCGAGIKPARGWTSIEPARLFAPDREPVCDLYAQDPHNRIKDHNHRTCPMCNPPRGNHGLIWIGGKYYSTHAFVREAREVGVSRKLSAVPLDLVIGETVVYLGHREAIVKPAEFGAEPSITPGVFASFRPTHIDLVIDNPADIPERALNIAERLGDKARLVKVVEVHNEPENGELL